MRKTLLPLAIFSVCVIAAFLATRQSHAADETKAAAIGETAPTFSLSDQDGKTVNLKDFAGKIVVLEWTNPECPFVQRHYAAKTMTTLAAEYKDRNVVWLAINTTNTATNATNKTWATAQSISYPILNDSAGKVGHAYGAKTSPHMFIIGTDGKLLYKGGIDNDADDSLGDKKVNYVRKALTEILSGKPVSEPETKSYGCGVKYAD